jgi:hypothetical protein
VDVRPVDPRDAGWEIDSPPYRVYFWKRPPAPPGIPPDEVMYHSTEFELSGAVDVREVLAWAEANATPGSRYTVYAVVGRESERGLVRLAGVDPTAPSS